MTTTLFDQPTIEEIMPPWLDPAARARFERESAEVTGIVWDWEKASNEVKNRYRLRIMLESEQRMKARLSR